MIATKDITILMLWRKSKKIKNNRNVSCNYDKDIIRYQSKLLDIRSKKLTSSKFKHLLDVDYDFVQIS